MSDTWSPEVSTPNWFPGTAPTTASPGLGDLFEGETETRGNDTPNSTPPGSTPAAPQSAPTPHGAATMQSPAAQAAAPSMHQAAPPSSPPAWTPRNTRRYQAGDRLWRMVDAVIAVVTTDPALQAMVGQLELARDPDVDQRQKQELLNELKPRLSKASVMIVDPQDIEPVLDMAYDELVGISVLGELWRDPEITEVMVDAWNRITIEVDGHLQVTPITFRDPEHANAVARSLAVRVSQRAVSRAIPLVTAELPGARITFTYGAVVKSGLSITMRKFRTLLGLQDLITRNSISPEMADFLRDAVTARAGILVSGGTGTGKTTIINLLSSFIPDTERVITIEDAFELSLSNTHVVSLQTKEAASIDDSIAVHLSDLLRNTLRMRPDRIIVGEIRESEGARVMLAAANTGHDGTMTTIHASSADLAVNERLVDLARAGRDSDDRAIRRTIASAFELVVQVTRGRGGIRYISEIAACDRALTTDGQIRLHPVFTASDNGQGTVTFAQGGKVPAGSALAGKLDEAGIAGRWA